MVMAEMKLHAMDMVVGNKDICLEASRYSEVECCPRHAKKTPMRAEIIRVEESTRYSSQPNSTHKGKLQNLKTSIYLHGALTGEIND